MTGMIMNLLCQEASLHKLSGPEQEDERLCRLVSAIRPAHPFDQKDAILSGNRFLFGVYKECRQDMVLINVIHLLGPPSLFDTTYLLITSSLANGGDVNIDDNQKLFAGRD